MNRHFLLVLCLIIAQSCAVAQQSTNENALNGYMCASASTGELKSAAMSIKRVEGTFEKLENGESVLKLSRGDFVEFGFTLPKTASNVKATIKYYADKETPCFIRWNNVNPSENEGKNVNPKKKENLYYKIYELNKQQRDNVLRVMTEGNAGLKFYNIIITYEYSKPSDNKDDFNVTLNNPDPAKSIVDYDKIEFKWTGVGDCPKEGGWITIQFCDNNNDIWKTVPGAEYIDLNGKDWKETSKGKFEGKVEWENHGLTEMPDFRIVFTKGSSPFKKAKKLFDEGKYQEALVNINHALKAYPQKKEFKDLRIKIVRSLNPFDIECRNDSAVTSVTIKNKKEENVAFDFVYVKDNPKGFWILNQEVSQAQWQTIVEDNPSKNQGDNFPVENVSWDLCKSFNENFKKQLIEKYGNSVQTVTVTFPTEKQWELACKSLKNDQIHFNNYWWGWGAPDTIEVRSKSKNSLGIYGMQGNVAEWCLDNQTNKEDPSMKIIRGGSCYDRIDDCQPESRKEMKQDQKNEYTGFRFVVIPQ